MLQKDWRLAQCFSHALGMVKQEEREVRVQLPECVQVSRPLCIVYLNACNELPCHFAYIEMRRDATRLELYILSDHHIL